MNEPYEDDEDDTYDDEQYNYDDNPYKWYYKFDIGPDTPVSNWLTNIVNQWLDPSTIENWNIINISGFTNQKFPVSSWNPNAGKKDSYQYLGSNYQNSPIWKKQYFVIDKIYTDYKLHLQSHAGHFVQQPIYYRGMFDILN